MIKLVLALAFLCSLGRALPGAEENAIVVAADGTGHFNTVQGAIESIPDGNAAPRLILIKPGTYKEQVVVKETKPFITLRGHDRDARKAVVTFDRYAMIEDPKRPGKRIGTPESETVSVRADNFTAENITFENTAGRLAPAMAVRVTGDKAVFRNCRFLSWQDTLCVMDNRSYFHGCYAEGRVDFVFGNGTAVFEKCHLHATDGGVIAAASTKPDTAFGLVFLKCKVTCKEDRTYLGAPWQRGAAIAFIECELGENLWPQGWTEWRGEDHHKTARFVEYKNTGPGSVPEKRPAWTRQLSDAEARSYTAENILAGTDGWNPRP